MITNRSAPSSTVIPEIPYPDMAAAAAWLATAFGFTVRLRIGNHRTQINVGDGAVVLIEWQAGTSPHRTMVRVQDVDAIHASALRHGARVPSAPTDYPYGERQCSIEDLAGHLWKFSQSIADVDPRAWGGEPGVL